MQMIVAYHVIFAAQGFWLPNDPRGSWSEFVALWDLFLFGGGATKTTDRRSLARRSHDRRRRIEAKRTLKYPPVIFNGKQALAIIHGFARAIEDAGYVIYACAVMPDHVHLVVARHERPVERIVGHLKAEATRQMDREGVHPFADTFRPDGTRPSPWVERCWKVFLHEDDVLRAIDYVEKNPVRAGLKRQKWSFVRAYGG